MMCYIGELHEDDKCHLEHYTRNKSLNLISNLSNELKLYLSFRIKNFDINVENKFICDHHLHKYDTRYTSIQRKCCNSFNNHSKSIENNLVMISADKCDKFRNICNINLDPGNKYCKNCEFKITSIITKNAEKDENTGNDGLNVNNNEQLSSSSQVS